MIAARNNPFASRHVESLAYQCEALSINDIHSLNDIMERLTSQNFRGAIIGPEGSGKTTLLETVGARLHDNGFNCQYLYFNTEKKRLEKETLNQIPENQIRTYAFLIDGAEQLSRITWQRLYFYIKSAGAVVVTAHRKSPLPTLVNTRTSPALLHDLVLKLIGRQQMISEQQIIDLYHRHHGDIRQALRELYDVWAEK